MIWQIGLSLVPYEVLVISSGQSQIIDQKSCSAGHYGLSSRSAFGAITGEISAESAPGQQQLGHNVRCATSADMLTVLGSVQLPSAHVQNRGER